MDLECDESANSSSNSKIISILSNSSLSSRNSIGRSVFTGIDTNITSNTEIQVVTNIWVNMFKENPKTGTIKLFTVIMNCFDVDVCDTLFTNFNSSIIFTRIMKCFKTLAKTDSLLSPETIKKSLEIQKTLELLTSIFRYHNTLFFTNGKTFRSYFIFLRDILIKISQSDFIGPRLLSTYFGLKIITGLIQSNNLEFVRNNINILLNEFLIKRWKDTSCSVREIVLLELQLWIKIDPVYFLNDFWMYVYWALGDQSTSVQIIALETSKIILNMNSDIHNVNLLTKKIINVMANLLLSKNEEVVISAFTLYSILPSIEEDDDEQYMLNIESLILELILSEKSNVARVAAKHFVNKMVNSKPYGPEQLKVLLVVLDGIPSHMITIATSFFVDAIYDLCPVLTDFELISQILTLDNYIEKKDKCNLMVLLTYVVKWLITGIKPEQNIANMGDKNDVTQLHINTLKKREYTTYITMHLLIQLKECEDPTHAFSLWILLQFIDFEMLKDKMIISDILRSVSLFYHTWNIPTILEMVSKCIHIMTSNVQGYEKNYCLACIQNIAQVNINILKAGVENSHENTPNLLNQKDASIKLWSLSKYNHLPDDLEPLKYLSYYVPYLNSTQSNLIVSKYALIAYMEILRKELLKIPTYSQNNTSIDQSLENTFFNFLDAIFNILCKCNPQVVTICETAFLIVDELLRVMYIIKETYHVLDSNQNKMLADFIFNICRNSGGIENNNNDSSTLKLIDIYIQLIQDGFIDMNHLLTLLQFVKMESFEHALRPIFKFFCKKQTGYQFSCVINQYLIYMFENIISQNPSFKDSTIKDVIDVATIITRLLCQCGDQIGKRLVSTNIHRHGIQYAMCDLLNNPYCSDYPFKHYFWVLASMCDTLIPYDAQRLADYFLDKSTTHELINSGNEHVLRYLYKLQELCDTEEISFSSET